MKTNTSYSVTQTFPSIFRICYTTEKWWRCFDYVKERKKTVIKFSLTWDICLPVLTNDVTSRNVITTHACMCFHIVADHNEHFKCSSAHRETSSRTLKFTNVQARGFGVVICSFSVKHFQVRFFATQNDDCKNNNTVWDFKHIACASKYFHAQNEFCKTGEHICK